MFYCSDNSNNSPVTVKCKLKQMMWSSLSNILLQLSLLPTLFYLRVHESFEQLLHTPPHTHKTKTKTKNKKQSKKQKQNKTKKKKKKRKKPCITLQSWPQISQQRITINQRNRYNWLQYQQRFVKIAKIARSPHITMNSI